MDSCIYEGEVMHRRLTPARHAFRYRLFMMYLDLSELPSLFRPYRLWSAQRPNLAWFRRRDHLGDPEQPLEDCVRRLVAERTGVKLSGPVRLLTHLCYGGHRFNPVSLYYCFDAQHVALEAVVAEVTNTPWGERHVYILPAGWSQTPPPRLRFSIDKAFHVSPFMGMAQTYEWHLSTPAERLTVHIVNHEAGAKVFDAALVLRRREISRGALARVLMRYPLMTMQVTAAIHYQALRLWLKRCPYHPHPGPRAMQVTP